MTAYGAPRELGDKRSRGTKEDYLTTLTNGALRFPRSQAALSFVHNAAPSFYFAAKTHACGTILPLLFIHARGAHMSVAHTCTSQCKEPA